MNKKNYKIIKYTMLSFLIICSIFIIITTIFFLNSYKVKFDEEKITSSNLTIEFFDNKNKPMRELNNFNTSYVKLNSLPSHIKECFISIEDKNFYKHNGLNYKRMLKAILSNIKSGKIKQGASTISQQLVKNTHLTNERTYKRKINEIIITKQLEKKFNKNEILEAYLNIIYFGNNCYGIENASQYYFSKKAKDLNLNECATLAGMIKSPNNYCPIKNYNNSIKRRNIVLRELYKDKKITYDLLEKNTNLPIKLKINNIKNDKLNTYSELALSEAIDILKCPSKQIAIANYKIYTYKNNDTQNNLIKNLQKNNDIKSDYAGISITKDGYIDGYIGKSAYKIAENPRQPGSTIKPILVYAPALEENLITTSTQILDEKININGYQPNNVNNYFNGYVSVKKALSKSLNIPTIKILSYLSINKAKSYATKCGIRFSNNDTGYSIGLGGMTNGTTLKDITGSYLPFINNGYMIKPTTIKYITDDNGKIIYKNETIKNKIYRDDTMFLINDMLKEAAKTGTSKILKDLPFEVASKSGTVGIKSKNFDAWSISYTSDNIFGIWLGNMDNQPIPYVGGGLPTKICKNILNDKYKNIKPKNFNIPSSINEIEIDLIELNENHNIVKANDFTPTRYRQKEYFSRFNEPKETSNKFITISPPTIKGNINNGKANISFIAKDYLIYELYKIKNNIPILCQIVSNKNGLVNLYEKIENNNILSYYVVSKIKNFTNNSEIVSEKSNIIELISVGNSNLINNNNKKKTKWYI